MFFGKVFSKKIVRKTFSELFFLMKLCIYFKNIWAKNNAHVFADEATVKAILDFLEIL